MVTERARARAIDKLYSMALTRAKDAAGGERAFWIIGSSFRRALVAQEILTIVAHQDETTAAESVRTVLDGLRDRLSDDQSLYQ